ncbi:MAG: 30S ribosomal protein S8 [Candidatus Bathyarchaeota archaeon]|nr:30S ribosomal protein S8 [Candidatus Bathyarchaeota archaeon]
MIKTGEMLITIKNAHAANKRTVSVPYSTFKYELAKILEKKGLVEEVQKRGRLKKKIVIKLKYEDNKPRIHDIRMISKSGRRIYLKSKDLFPPKSGYGILIVSTSKGLLTSEKAKKMNLGGEAICEIW